MGPEVVAAIIGSVLAPTLGGFVSLLLFLNKKNSDHIEKQFSLFNDKVENVVVKIDQLGVEMRDGYVKNELLQAHIKAEDEWHKMFSNELTEIKDSIKDLKT